MSLDQPHYKGLYLSKMCIEYFDRPITKLNETQLQAIDRFHQIILERGDFLNLRGAVTPSKSSVAVLEDFLAFFNDMSFFSSLPTCSVGWESMNTRDKRVGYCQDNVDNTCNIKLDSSHVFPEWLLNSKGAMYSHINNLLHEATHAFLMRYVCRECPQYGYICGDHGHGRAWQLLTAKLEQKVPELLGFKCNLNRLRSLRNHLGYEDDISSPCDLQAWDFTPVYGPQAEKVYLNRPVHRLPEEKVPDCWENDVSDSDT